MGSPTSDDDPPRRVPAPGSWGLGGPPHQYPTPPQGGGQQGPPPSYPPGQGSGHPPPGQYPPSGPGGPYPPPGGPGGPYPPPGQPGPYGYGGPPPDGGRNRRGLVIALVAGLVILVGIAAALVFAFTRDDGKTVSADLTASPSAGSSSSSAPSSSPSPSESTSSAPSSQSDNGGDRTDELLALVPVDFTDCAETDLAGDGDVAAVTCGSSSTQPGPETASFYLYEDSQTLDQVFVQDVEAEGIEPLPDGEDCDTAQGVTTWDVDGVEGGNLACTIGTEGVLIAWTDREFGIEAVVTAPGSTQEELAVLAGWWRANSDFQR
jgi:hypothetical protein